MRKWLRAVSIVGLVAGLMLAMTAPASATIHEIVGSWCASTHEVPSPTGHLHDPPGLSGISNGDNIAQPLLATGAFVPDSQDMDGDGKLDPVLLVNEDAPQVKLRGSGDFFPFAGTWIEIGTTEDSDFPAFAHCANLQE